MAYLFKHFPKGSTVGSGDFVFRHYGEETLTNLAGTKWRLNDEISMTSLVAKPGRISYKDQSLASSSKTYDIEFLLDGVPQTKPFKALKRHQVDIYFGSGGAYYHNNFAHLYIGTSEYFKYGYAMEYTNSDREPFWFVEPDSMYTAGDVITIVSGADCTNQTLIDWFTNNAERVFE